MSIASRVTVVLLGLMLSACSTQSTAPDVKLPRSGSWVLLPLLNYAQAPQAAEGAEQILYSVLAAKGLNATPYPVMQSADELPLETVLSAAFGPYGEQFKALFAREAA